MPLRSAAFWVGWCGIVNRLHSAELTIRVANDGLTGRGQRQRMSNVGTKRTGAFTAPTVIF
jgi:hypothetical protein